MDIARGIRIIGLSLYLERQKTLVISDLHLGYEESLNKKGVLIPRFQFGEMKKALEGILSEAQSKVETVVLNGDLKHEFGRISDQEWRELSRLIEFLQNHAENIVIIKGNHDAVLAPVTRKKGIVMKDKHRSGDILILHGDVIPKRISKDIKTVIIGHEHPAISIREAARVERFKCFAKGKWKGRTLIVMPSMNPLVEGTDLLEGKALSPFLKGGLKEFQIWIAADDVYYFGALNDIDRE